jgi:hypothetical protein
MLELVSRFESEAYHVLPSRVGSMPYLGTLDQAERACQGQTL